MTKATEQQAGWRAPEARGAFGGFIGPKNLVDLVANAAPWLFDASRSGLSELPIENPGSPGSARLCELGDGPLGWLSILRASERLEASLAPTSAQRTDYFALCLAAHFASAATYVPTDVDAKIRHALWLDQTDPDELARMRDLALSIGQWDMSGVSARIVHVQGCGPLSGHDGERLSVLCGALVACAGFGDTAGATLCETAIEFELAREARAFDALARENGRELTLVTLASILTHNAGDVMQSLGAKGASAYTGDATLRFGDLARERFERYGGAFGRAAAIYREIGASEGHRNYPLREVKLLRASPDLLLPNAPFLDEWGMRLATWPTWKLSERAQVVTGLLDGCKRVAGQQGYFRALAGFDRAFPGGLASRELAQELTGSTRKFLASTEVRPFVEVKRESFEASQAKRVRRILGR